MCPPKVITIVVSTGIEYDEGLEHKVTAISDTGATIVTHYKYISPALSMQDREKIIGDSIQNLVTDLQTRLDKACRLVSLATGITSPCIKYVTLSGKVIIPFSEST